MFRRQDYSDKELYQAVKVRFEADRFQTLTNMKIIFENPTGVADHPDIVSTLSDLAKKLADAEDVISCLEKYFENNSQ